MLMNTKNLILLVSYANSETDTVKHVCTFTQPK